ncbi:hypothetical protein BH23ACT9_BH23ACT9_27250 [soil metagenome]
MADCVDGIDAVAGKQATATSIGWTEDRGWGALIMPQVLHPWAFHNAVLWLSDLHVDVIGIAEASDAGPAYWVGVGAAEDGEELAGFDEGGIPITVTVPDNRIVRAESSIGPAQTILQAMAKRGAPTSLLSAPPTGPVLRCRLEDPGDWLNPRNAETHGTLRQMRTTRRARRA